MHSFLSTSPRSRTGLTALAVTAALTLTSFAAAAPAVQAAPVSTARVSAAHVGTVRAAPAPAVPSTGQGPLTSTACTAAGGTAACDLWTATGTLALSGANVAVWGFTSVSGTPASGRGPVLVVTSGDAVTVTLHNTLPRNVSLAVPGVAMIAPGTSVRGEDVTGVAAGASAAYTFTAPAAGTYLYEAGHTANGPRQVAMGLVGAMVVRPAGFDVAAPTQDGSLATAFDDEAVLVLGEVDPAFNAAPDTYDLRRYHPTYRLINGRSFPGTEAIATGHGRSTLVRYVNGGLLAHSMGVLGAKEQVLAIGGHADTGRVQLVSDMVTPGQTEDVRIAFPAGGPSSMPLYETAGTLDNAGQVTAVGSRVVALGGMMTFLTAGAVGSSGDTVGPKSSGVTVMPKPVTPLSPATVTATVSDVATGNGNVKAAELIVDSTVVAVGGGVVMTAVDGVFDSPTEAVTGTIDTTVLQGLAQGTHTVYVRGQDAAAVPNWGPVASTTFTMGLTGPTTSALALASSPTNGSSAVRLTASGDDSSIGGTVTAGEYFLDTAAADGSGTAMVVSTPARVAALSATLDTVLLGGLVQGKHTLYVHAKDDNNLWGAVVPIDLVMDRTGPSLGTTGNQVTPNPTNGLVGDPVDPTALKVHVTLVDPVTSGVSSAVVAAEGFLDATGTAGTGIVFVADDGSWSSSSEAGYGLVPLSQVVKLPSGSHTVFVHGRDAAGNWGTLAPLTFVVDRGPTVVASAPVTVGVLAAPIAVGVATSPSGSVSAAEWFETVDPGPGLATPLGVTSTGASTATLTLDPSQLTLGTHLLRQRARSSGGTWGATVSVQVTVTALISDTFESGTTAAWSATTGNVSVVTSSALQGARLLRVSGGNAYLTSTLAAATPALHATFLVSPQTLSTGSSAGAWVSVMQGRTAGGTTVVDVQYHRQGTAAPQVRLVVSSGAGTSTSAAVTLPTATASAVRVDWLGGTTGTAVLTVNGSASPAQPSATTLQVSALRLGLVGTGTTGRLFLDSYLASR